MDIVVTVPKSFTHPAAPGKRGLAAWLAEGDPPGADWSGQYWAFTTSGARPRIEPGERVYVVCEGRLVGFSPLLRLHYQPVGRGFGRFQVELVRAGGAVAVTLPTPIVGFRGWRYRWWDRADEEPFGIAKYLE